jgi:hypothetical protein
MRVKFGLLALGAALLATACHAEPPLVEPVPAGGNGVPPVGRRGSGAPPSVACYAHPSNTKSYCGYYVGGGSAWRGQPRCLNEGTWGWDYHGCLIPQRVFLQWWHGRYQGGSGAYKIDGPHFLKPGKHAGENPTP